MSADLFTNPDAPVGWECPGCGWAGYVTEAERAAHRCGGFNLDRAITVFLNRWAFNWRGERADIEQELRELIAEAKK